MKGCAACILLLIEVVAVRASTCDPKVVDFIVQEGDATLAAIEDDVRSDLAKVDITVNTRMLNKADFNSNMTSGNFHLCFSETWGPPYDPHSYASSWKSPDEAHFAAMKGMQAPMTQAQLSTEITNVLVEWDLQKRQQKWATILKAVHDQAIDLPFSGKRIPSVLRSRLTGYMPGQQQFDYPVHSLQVLSGSKEITVAAGGQTGLFSSVGRLDPHTYRPNEFFSNNWVYEGLVSYGAGGVIEPCLATSWTAKDLTSGGQEYTFTLRQGVKFHDNSDWNCAVAKLNFDHVLAKPLTTGDWHGWYDLPKQITSWSCAGTYTFIVNTKDKYYPLLQELTYIRPLRMLSGPAFKNGITTDPNTANSCHAGWGTISGNGDTITCAGIIAVSGTGPFRFVETRTNGDAQLVAHTSHWRSVPQVTSIILKKYASHAAVMAALLDGSLDAVLGAGVLEPADLKTIQTKHAATFQVYLGPPIQNRMIILNANKAPTNDLQLRKVIMHAVNKADIIDKELYGFAGSVDTLFPKNAPFCDVDLTPRWDYDFEKATLLRGCSEEEAAASTSSTSSTATESDDDGISVGLVVGIVVAAVVVTVIAAVAFFVYGKSQGVMQQKLLQSQSKQMDAGSEVVGNPGEGTEVI
jgi:ABC-type transport system substrate-binding protein